MPNLVEQPSLHRLFKTFHVKRLNPHFEPLESEPVKLVVTGDIILIEPPSSPPNVLGKLSEFKMVNVIKALNPSDSATQLDRTRRIIQLNSYKEIQLFEMESEEIKNQFCIWWDRVIPILAPQQPSLIDLSARESLAKADETHVKLRDPILRLIDRIRNLHIKRLETQKCFENIKSSFAKESKDVFEQISTLSSLEKEIQKVLVSLKTILNNHSKQQARFLTLLTAQSKHERQLIQRESLLQIRTTTLDTTLNRFEKVTRSVMEHQSRSGDHVVSLTVAGVVGAFLALLVVVFSPNL